MHANEAAEATAHFLRNLAILSKNTTHISIAGGDKTYVYILRKTKNDEMFGYTGQI